MSDLTLEEKTNFAEERARVSVHEKHFYDLNAPHFGDYFSVSYRNDGHWDINAPRAKGHAAAIASAHPGRDCSGEKEGDLERAFRIRGEPGNVIVMDERWNPHKPHPRASMTFRTIGAAMLWISEELMHRSPRT